MPAAEESMRAERARAGAAVTAPLAFGAGGVGVAPLVDSAVTAYERRVAETIVRPSARPVLAIRDNRVTTEFLGPDSEIWKARIDGAKAVLDIVTPSIGRVELKNNADFSWVGTGWLVADDIIVTNRHVAREFGRGTPDGFVFRVGVNGGPQSAQIDFLEEFDRSGSLEFTIDSILWIATPTEPDVAYLRVRRPAANRRLAAPIPLAETVAPDDFVVTIGYPARDPRVPDQRLVERIFGDVYEKKRLAPGQVTDVGPDELQHDCSTLGGNSGSPVINLRTGEAVGLHFSGLFLESNFAVPASRVRELLRKVQRAEAPGMGPIRGPASPVDERRSRGSGGARQRFGTRNLFVSVSHPGRDIREDRRHRDGYRRHAGPGAYRPAQRPSATQRRWALQGRSNPQSLQHGRHSRVGPTSSRFVRAIASSVGGSPTSV